MDGGGVWMVVVCGWWKCGGVWMVMVWIVVCDGWMMVLWRMVLGCSGVWMVVCGWWM